MSVVTNIPPSSSFLGDKNEDVNDWLEVINQKFDACELTGPQRQKWAVAFLSNDALKWHTRNVVKLETWNDFQTALKDNFPPPPAPSSSIIFHQLLSRKQGNTELFNRYYADIIKLCHRYDPLMSDDTRCDILKSGMNKILLDKCCGKGLLLLMNYVNLLNASNKINNSSTLGEKELKVAGTSIFDRILKLENPSSLRSPTEAFSLAI
ncbi:unnamed protein product [Didymodactylos carnosus]|uniref:Retrotransposon gag domain-containing protein n=1 Tax=Didymodactylos carnosus TaxID=1234261 RepID=A0A814N1G0_9BILA|nr:unnamed protein product [Didymodactylos carnosus]CAF1086148.1 unnamed protein product [Didymodactylos carnosus]CAF3634265.1 unnamed protein product [Didymodactylos carnosus]CAF3851722.1 unnamed protein product [Didymodactylos carnosus]